MQHAYRPDDMPCHTRTLLTSRSLWILVNFWSLFNVTPSPLGLEYCSFPQPPPLLTSWYQDIMASPSGAQNGDVLLRQANRGHRLRPIASRFIFGPALRVDCVLISPAFGMCSRKGAKRGAVGSAGSMISGLQATGSRRRYSRRGLAGLRSCPSWRVFGKTGRLGVVGLERRVRSSVECVTGDPGVAG